MFVIDDTKRVIICLTFIIFFMIVMEGRTAIKIITYIFSTSGNEAIFVLLDAILSNKLTETTVGIYTNMLIIFI
jgi:hypothetical protein